MTRPATTVVPRSVRRRGIVYGFRVVHPGHWPIGEVVLGYVGQTRQALPRREDQHREEQPWADTIVGETFVIEQGDWTADELDDREEYYIHTLLPLYNIEHNLDNPNRIPPWVAREQATARGHVVAPKVPPDPRSQLPRSQPTQARGAAPRRRKPAWRRKAERFGWCATGWALVAGSVWVWVAASGWAETAEDGAGAGMVLASGLALGVVWVRNKVRRIAKKLR